MAPPPAAPVASRARATSSCAPARRPCACSDRPPRRASARSTVKRSPSLSSLPASEDGGSPEETAARSSRDTSRSIASQGSVTPASARLRAGSTRSVPATRPPPGSPSSSPETERPSAVVQRRSATSSPTGTAPPSSGPGTAFSSATRPANPPGAWASGARRSCPVIRVRRPSLRPRTARSSACASTSALRSGWSAKALKPSRARAEPASWFAGAIRASTRSSSARLPPTLASTGSSPSGRSSPNASSRSAA